MAFTLQEAARNEAALRSFIEAIRPPVHIRKELDFDYSASGHAIELHEIRPDWQGREKLVYRPFARIRCFKTTGWWRLYWMRSDLKWHIYDPSADHRSLRAALEVVRADAYGCFFG